MNESLELTVEDILNASLDRGESVSDVTKRVITSVVEGLSHQKDGELKIRAASEMAVLTVARRWGNVIQAGKASVEATAVTAQKVGMNHKRATEQATIGAADGVMRVGPIAYPHLKRELAELVDDVDEVIARGRNLPAIYESREHPVIVPMSEESIQAEVEAVAEMAAAELPPTRIEPVKNEAPVPVPVATPAPAAKQSFLERVVGFFRGIFKS
ncbi:MAG: hypothetical protein KC910_21440 [Candidatus Eremiobacteraeota bacterium]|nr:hypothetical protein [Candidatus Eremiobacteraeota bacterium]